MTYVDPRSLRDPLKRIYLNAARRFGAEIRIRVLGESEGYIEAIIEVEGSEDLIIALRHLGIRMSKRPIPAKFSERAIAEILEKISEDVPIGLGEKGEIIRVDIAKPIATNSIEAAFFLTQEKSLWIDFAGDPEPLDIGFEEIDGLPISRSETKLHNLASVIAHAFGRSEDQIFRAIKAHITGIMQDEEIQITSTPEVEKLFKWRVIVENEAVPKRAYIDFTGLPMTLQRAALRIAPMIWAHQLIVALPSPWSWVMRVLRRRHTVILTPDPQKLDAPTIILDDRVIKKVALAGEATVIERKYKPLWHFARSLLNSQGSYT